MPGTSRGVPLGKGAGLGPPHTPARLQEPNLPGLLNVQQVAPMLLRNGGGQPVEASYPGEQAPPNCVHSSVHRSSHFRFLLGVAWNIAAFDLETPNIPKPSSGSEAPFPTWTPFYTWSVKQERLSEIASCTSGSSLSPPDGSSLRDDLKRQRLSSIGLPKSTGLLHPQPSLNQVR